MMQCTDPNEQEEYLPAQFFNFVSSEKDAQDIFFPTLGSTIQNNRLFRVFIPNLLSLMKCSALLVGIVERQQCPLSLLFRFPWGSYLFPNIPRYFPWQLRTAVLKFLNEMQTCAVGSLMGLLFAVFGIIHITFSKSRKMLRQEYELSFRLKRKWHKQP